MTTGTREGWFTNRALDDYIGGASCDYYNARKIINGHDHATDIAAMARKLEILLRLASW